MDVEAIIAQIIKCAYKVSKHLEPGYLEILYRKAMAIEISNCNMRVIEEAPIQVEYEGHVIGSYRADLLVEDAVIVELKALSALSIQHELQLVNYLTATGLDNGLLINFGSEKVQIKRKYRLYKQ